MSVSSYPHMMIIISSYDNPCTIISPKSIEGPLFMMMTMTMTMMTMMMGMMMMKTMMITKAMITIRNDKSEEDYRAQARNVSS